MADGNGNPILAPAEEPPAQEEEEFDIVEVEGNNVAHVADIHFMVVEAHLPPLHQLQHFEILEEEAGPSGNGTVPCRCGESPCLRCCIYCECNMGVKTYTCCDCRKESPRRPISCSFRGECCRCCSGCECVGNRKDKKDDIIDPPEYSPVSSPPSSDDDVGDDVDDDVNDAVANNVECAA